MTTTTAQQSGEQPTEPRFEFQRWRIGKPYNVMVKDDTGHWYAKEEVDAALSAPPSPESSSQGSLDDSAPEREPLTDAQCRNIAHAMVKRFQTPELAPAEVRAIIELATGSTAA